MRSLVAIGVGIGVVAIVAVIAVMGIAPRTPAELPPGSPEAALQVYLEAFDAQDFDTAYASFSSRVQDFMGRDEFARWSREFLPADGQIRRVVVDEVTIGDGEGGGGADTASLQLTVFIDTGGLFPTEYSYQTAVPMVREDGEWRLDQALVHVDPAPLPDPAVP